MNDAIVTSGEAAIRRPAFDPRALGAGGWLLVAGLASLVLPTLASLAKGSWSTEAGAHGPIVLATACWLVWHEQHFLADARRQPLLPGALFLALWLPLYAIGRITGVLVFESLALYATLATLAWLAVGPRVFARYWFVLVYALFLITPPENWIFVATRPLKMALADASVDFLTWCGLPIGNTGTMILVDGYQLLVASACSGLNSLIGITAISLFYVYLRHGSEPRYAFALVLALLPVAVLTNFLRVVFLILSTHWFGIEVAQGLVHDIAGLGTFALALALLVGIDAALHPLFTRTARRPA